MCIIFSGSKRTLEINELKVRKNMNTTRQELIEARNQKQELLEEFRKDSTNLENRNLWLEACKKVDQLTQEVKEGGSNDANN